MPGVLRADPLWVETFTGLRMRQFERLLKVVRERGGDGPRLGRPWCLPLADRVLVVSVYYRTNLTMRQLAPLFGISPATVCRVIQRLAGPCSRSGRPAAPRMHRTGCGSRTARSSRSATERWAPRPGAAGFSVNV